jgi:sterol desaturase/sphingolipid hydroxylase (fatty acid hydroxylase superfamily)
MVQAFFGPIAANIAATVWSFLPSALGFAALFTVLAWFPGQACNRGRIWWRNPGLYTDLLYVVIVPFVAPYMRMSLMIGVAALLSGFVSAGEIAGYFEHGLGPLGRLPFWGQVGVYIVASDFMLYWAHRLFHGAALWRFHAIHHSAEQVDWTTAYRFHPVNLWLGPFLATAIMLYLGVSPAVLLFLVPFDTTTAAFVHANLNWTLGPLKYVVATPVFHRWHHTTLDQGGNRNFGSMFSLWDVIFGSFYMPPDALPSRYGIDEDGCPQGFFQQLIHPFRDLAATAAQRELSPPPPP